MTHNIDDSVRETAPTDPRSVFVVHGRNEQARQAMFEFLRAIDLRPMEWMRAIELTGEASPYIGQVLDAAFSNATAVVVLMTPDEIAYLQPQFGNGDEDPQTKPARQARPNVLFEAGMALGRHPARTVLVEIGDLRSFSDVAGRHAVHLTNAVVQRQDLAQRLKNAGCAVDLGGTDWQTTGDFSAPPGPGLPLGRRVPSSSSRPPVDLDVKYLDRGNGKIGRLQVINRGTETAYNVEVAVPDGTALTIHNNSVIEKIPGGGKSVTLEAWTATHTMGGDPGKVAFDLTLSADTDRGERITKDVFIDLNG